MRGLVVWGLLLAACGNELPEAIGFRSGARLRARLLDGGGGAGAFRGWQDLQTGQPCGFALAQDGRQRCLPSADSAGHFSDAGCLQPALWLPAGVCPSERYATSGGQLFHFGDRLPDSAPLYRQVGGSCTVFDRSAGDSAFTLEAVDETTFVAATEAVEPRDTQLGVRVLVADDGAREQSTIVTLADNQPCEPVELGPDDVRCLRSDGLQSALAWADPACAQPLIVSCMDPKPDLAILGDREACPYLPQLWSLGDEATAFYGKTTNGGCAPEGQPVTGPCHYYHPGQAVSHDALPALSFATAGRGRLRARYAATTDGQDLLPPDELVDTQLDAPCQVDTLSDGSLRCLTLAAYPGAQNDTVFSDASCSHPLIRVTGCVPPQWLLQPGGEGCAANVSARGAGAPYQGNLFTRGPSGCVALPQPSNASFFAPLPVGATVDPGLFPGVAERVE